MVDNRNSDKNKILDKGNDTDDFIIGPVTRTTQSKKVESRVLVLDYLPEGKGFGQDKQREPIIQGIGTTWFTLLELITDRRGNFNQFEEILLPKESEKSPIKQVKRRLSINDITNTGYQSLEEAVLKIINKNEKRFVSFFNKAQPITNRIHSLQLIPGIGKKLMWEILQTRKGMPFVSFSDIEERVKISDIQKMIQNRVMQEIEEEEKHRLFTASPESVGKK